MPSDGEKKAMADIAAGGQNGVFVLLQMARRFYDRDGATGMAEFVERAFPTLPVSDQTALVSDALAELFGNAAKPTLN